MKKIDLKDCTFIIPVKLESQHRIKNAEIVLNFLNDNFDTNIIIYEFETNKVPELINITDNINYINEKNPENKPFHRTAFLNKMLKLVKTHITVNYDIDVILPLESYTLARDAIQLDSQFDLIFPYGFGQFQKMVSENIKDELISNKNIFKVMDENSIVHLAEFGHVQFFNTSSYIQGGMENEDFISYAPEDKERNYRFMNLGYKVGRINNSFVYHLEHERNVDSNDSNPFFQKNMELWQKILKMPIFELIEYYKNK